MTLEVVGGAFFSAFFEQVFLKMDSQEVKNFIRGKKLMDGLLKKLRIKLMSVNAVFEDAEEKQISNPGVKQWLHELKEAVLEAEDLLDEIKTDALRRKMESEFGSNTNKVQDLISASFHAFDKSVDCKVEEILERLGFIADQKDAFDFQAGGRHRISPILPSTSLVEGSDVYGREHDKDVIIKLLLSDDSNDNKIGVIPIQGMGGIGKTTLAQLVFNDDTVKENFDLQAWVCVSEVFDVAKITQTIYESVTSQACDITDLNDLQVRLKKALKGKKFFFVLDDVWNEKYSYWDSLRRPFASGAHGSKIIVTTRNKGVASTTGTLQTHHLKHMLEEDSWFLFAKHAFKNATVTIDPNLEVIGRNIVSKCKGLPLAAKSLGALLRSESKVEEWENVLKSDIWELSDKNSDILPALWLSYQYLPPHLKRCFVYCSIFPKDYKFHKSKLVLLWMAEDLLLPNKKKMMEEVGESYFDDLISRSFFQHTLSHDCFIMHDLINDLAKFVSGEFCIRLESHDSLANVGKARYFSCMEQSHDFDFEGFDTLYEAKYLRTFLLGNLYPWSMVQFDLLLKLQCLRVLKLQGGHIEELPDSVSNFKHLRYMDLCETLIQSLPDQICSLYNLQTLLLSKCGLLAELPARLSRLINLRHLDITATKIRSMPLHMGKLKNLQTLRGEFVLDHDTGENITELKGFKQLCGTLHISGLQNIVHEKNAVEAEMRNKKHLSEAILKGEGDTVDSQKDSRVLGNLQPHTNLEALTIENYGGTKFPSWLGDDYLSNLVTLRLVACQYCFSMPALGQLPSLKWLEIEDLNGVELVGSDFYGGIKPAFKSLEFLSFNRLEEWKEWSLARSNEEGGDFPNLRELSLQHCHKLTGRLPLDYFPRLERLYLYGVGLESLSSLQECNKWRIELSSLCKLEASSCRNLACFVGGGLLLAPKLTLVSLAWCKNLWTLPEEMHISLPSLKFMRIVECIEFKSFPDESKFPSLDMLEISGCPNFVGYRDGGRLQVPNLLGIQCEKLRSLPEEIVSFIPSLRSLDITYCLQFESFPEGSIFPSLDYLVIVCCRNFVGFPHGAGLHAPNLKKIDICECEKLRSLHALQLEEDCPEPESFLEESNKCSQLLYLRELKILKCPSFVGFPDGQGLRAPNLKEICTHMCENFSSLPEDMSTLIPSLESLSICYCPELESFPEGGLPSKLESLIIRGCEKLMANRMHWGLQRLISLRHLEINFRDCEEDIVDSFPEEGLLPTTLTSFEFANLLNLKIIEGKELGHLVSLKKLEIYGCPQLQSLPEEGISTSLSHLLIKNCDMLKQRCQRETGEDWPKIAHIAEIHID